MRTPADRTTTSRLRPLTVVAGLVSSLLLALSMNGTLSAFTASITNSTNTAATGYIEMRETLLDAAGAPTSTLCSSNDGSPAGVGTNSATCASINKYGGASVPMAPGQSQTTRISITNTGTIAATAFALTPSACTQSNVGPAS